MRPDDANVVGNVHGGIILKMIEEAGCIVCTRHCNTQHGVGQRDHTNTQKRQKKPTQQLQFVCAYPQLQPDVVQSFIPISDPCWDGNENLFLSYC